MRRGYLDWLRGVAVLIMIEAHTVDSWTRAPDRESVWFGHLRLVGGFGAPLFLFLAGIAVSLSAGSKYRKLLNAPHAASAVIKRGLEIFALAFLFRLQSFLLSPGSDLNDLLKVDILNIMGPSIVAAAALWGLADGLRARLAIFAAATMAVAMLTPIVRATPILSPLPDPIEWYLRPHPGRTNFVLFPWMAFVFAGALVGALLDATRDVERERRLNGWFLAAGLLVAAAACGASYLPSIYAASSFWTSSPTFFFLRVGFLTALVPFGFVVSRRPDGWLETFGRSSLFVYWIHVEMVYGLLSRPLHRALTLPAALAAFAMFTAALYGIVRLKNRATGKAPPRLTSA